MADIRIRTEPPTGTVWVPIDATVVNRIASNAYEVEVRGLPIEAELTYLDGCQMSIDGRPSTSVWGKSADRDMKAMTAILVVAVMLQ